MQDSLVLILQLPGTVNRVAVLSITCIAHPSPTSINRYYSTTTLHFHIKTSSAHLLLTSSSSTQAVGMALTQICPV